MTLARIKYAKGNEIKYISHLDFQRSFHRLLNRAGIDVAFSQGFNPHLKVSYAMAMPVGMTSEGEYLDVELVAPMDGEKLKALLNEQSPKGLEILAVKILEEPVKSLASVITEGILKVEVPVEDHVTENKIREVIREILKKDTLELTRKNKKGKLVTKNIRSYIKKLELDRISSNKAHLDMVLSMGSIDNLNPQLLLDYIIREYKIFKEFPKAKIHRVDMLVDGNEIDLK
ncbi:radical SAM-linked protein [Alkalibaculum bacchi]|uniref:Radical SAM-linked protein n=1 Tax=Alkalibaculum bacchi TaxID=645887 RepID=A0A366IGD3_9FIRM|nr:TIGR03936 family radical SAM-associated protein [Alkalibaculum bacchi]RBP68970.1 radical SAM-linked protein [Alkalibaculum bacchi]